MMKRLIPLVVLALAAGCSSKDADLDAFITAEFTVGVNLTVI